MKKVGLHIKDGKITTDDGKEMVLVYLELLERLREQLNEANELISLLFPLSINKERALERTAEYMEKWGVKCY